MAEQHHVGQRDEGRALPARGHVARAEVAHHRDAQTLGDHRGVAQLQRGPARLVPHRLAVRGDEREIARRDARLREQRQHRAREPLSERDVEQRQVFGGGARHGVDDRAALGRAVALLAERHQRGARRERVGAEAHQRRRDPVERRPRHQADGQDLAHLTAGGSPTTGRTNPPAASS